jgi:DNA-binding SARP family transcriptional activator
MVRFTLLGTIRIAREGDDADPTLLGQPKLLALLVFLVLARPHGFHQRDRLLGLLWPELDQQQARAALRKALHRLRQLFSDALIVTAGQDAVMIPIDERSCDVGDFEHAIALRQHATAVDCYAGPLTPGLFVDGAPQFDQWLTSERLRLHDLAMRGAWALVEQLVEQREHTDATRMARRVAQLADGDERMMRKVMTLLAQLGDRAGAIRAYRRFEQHLWQELEVRPAPETITLARIITEQTEPA